MFMFRNRAFPLFSLMLHDVRHNGLKQTHISGLSIWKKSMSQWHLVGAVCLERKPIITQGKTAIEKQYFHLIQQMEYEQSLKSDHELRHIEDLKTAERIKKDEDVDLDAAAKQTAQDFEDASTEELQKFQPASRISDSDESNDQQSLERKMDRQLLLVVKQKLGNDYRWVLPQGVHQEGESLRQTAERVLKETCGDEIKVQFFGNAPAGYYKYKYPKAARGNGVYGAKVFFFKAQWKSGHVCQRTIEQSSFIEDYLWLTRAELQEKLQPDYYKTVESFLVDDYLLPEDEENEARKM